MNNPWKQQQQQHQHQHQHQQQQLQQEQEEQQQQKQQQDCPLNSEYDKSNQIGLHDVLLGRGGAANNHHGNRFFRSIILQHQLEYLRAKKLDKAAVAKKVVNIIKSQGGRFLRRTSFKIDDDTWEEVDAKKALSKAGQALREGLDVRHTQLRIKKSNQSNAAVALSTTTATTTNFATLKPRKPYTIKKHVAHGNVRTIDERNYNEPNDGTNKDNSNYINTDNNPTSDCSNRLEALEEYVAMEIANLASRCRAETVE